MSRRRMDVLDVRELIRQMMLGQSDRQIARSLGAGRNTVQKYRQWVIEQGLVDGPLPSAVDLELLFAETFGPEGQVRGLSTVEPFRSYVEEQRQRNVEIQTIHRRLQERGYKGSYSSVRRFVKTLEPASSGAVIRIEVPPGEEMQVDFGYAGQLVDPSTGRLRKAWFGVFTLSWSRHQYVEFVWHQDLETWLLLHSHALSFFGGVPRRVVLDNLKAAIIRACFEDPEIQRSYRSCAEHYGFLIAPCKPQAPEQKGKVESGVHFVKRSFLAGRDPQSIKEANRDVITWVMDIAGQRCHGTTKEQPLNRFLQVEKPALLPLPDRIYEPIVWKQAKLHRDCHIVFQNAYYSAPYRLTGETLWVAGGLNSVRIFADHWLVATHPKVSAGIRQTTPNHLPPQKVSGILLTRDRCHEEAGLIGQATLNVIKHLLDDRPVDRLPVARAVLRLATEFGADRLERACTRCVYFEDYSYSTIKNVLKQNLDICPPPPDPPPRSEPPLFARPGVELLGSLQGGVVWN